MAEKPSYEELEQRVKELEKSSLEEEIENIFSLTPDLIGHGNLEGKYSAYPFPSQFFKKSLNFLATGYTQISLMGTLILPGGPSFPRPLVCPTLIQLAAL